MLYWDKLLNPKRIRETSSVIRTRSDNRSPFKKDFDTICNSTVLRRLQDKAQVFPLEEEDYARSRLTHSIEVLSIAESLGIQAREIIKKKENKKYISQKSDNSTYRKTNKLIDSIPTILMGAALLHDMGNPPFGHLGEQIINDWFKDNLQHFEYSSNDHKYVKCEMSHSSLDKTLDPKYKNDLLHFDGNAQLLRLITRLSLIVDDNGMNLSYPLIATIVKYPCSSSNINSGILSKKKAGYFSSEEKTYLNIANTLGLVNEGQCCRHPLAFLLEAADDIAYLTADIEDANHKAVISVADIDEYLEVFGKDDKIVESVRRAILDYKQAAINMNYPNTDDYIMHRLRIYIKGQMINAMAHSFEKMYEDIMNGCCEKELLEESEANALTSCLRELEIDKIHYCSAIVENKTRAIVVLNKLLNLYIPAVLNYNKKNDYRRDTEANLIYMSLSENYKYICEKDIKGSSDSDVIYDKLRLAIDQISGMTDTRAMKVYQTLSAT